jgi:uncharacterized membrane protein
VALALGSIALSWLLVHTLFALRHASIYYRDRAGGGFNEEKLPWCSDFTYLSLP